MECHWGHLFESGVQTSLKLPCTAWLFYGSTLRMEKDLAGWHTLKAEINDLHNSPTFQQREVWWCSIGVNIGHEEDGKGQYYRRPVLIVRKFNQHVFLGVPLTTQIKNNPYYHRINFKGREQCVMLSQLRLWESKRLTASMGKLAQSQFEEIRQAIRKMI